MPSPGAHDLIDAVDECDHVVGTVQRGQVLAQHLGFRTVHIVGLRRHSCELLLSQIGLVGTRSPGRWSSTVAGYLHAGETPLSGARRRLREEVGLETELSFRGRASMVDEASKKFVYVFSTETYEVPTISDHDHVRDLEFRDIETVRREVVTEPDAFTETFPYVLAILDRPAGADLEG